ncbi:MAG: hypothetical protein PVF17_08710, partial [Ignavibacteria bacterium]
MGYRYKSITRKGKGKSINEDAITVEVMDDGVLCIVCDGLSSGVGASNASKSCVKSIKDFFISSDERNNLTKIRDSIIHANSELNLLTKKEKELVGMATTSEVLFINNHTVYWGHTG